jgi:branched-chain amino acid transport system permease protein
VLGGLVEWGMIRPLYSRPIYQVLLTLGLVFVGTELIRGVWGPAGFYMDIPAFFNTRGESCPSPDIISWLGNNCASILVLGRPFPSYRIFIILLGVAMFVAIALLLRRTRMGMIIRAGVQDSDMVQALGINVRLVFTLVFALGTGLAALGGVAAAPFVGVNPGLGQEFLLLAFIAVVIGGMGSYSGAALGALLVGLARAFGDQLVLSGIQLPGMEEALKLSPSIARASTVLLMAAVLLIRPAGLFGKKE